MELLQAINGRRSVREYAAEPVDDALVRELIDAAVQAPSAINKQPWCFIVVKRPKLLAEISDKAKAHMLKISLNAPAHPISDMLERPEVQHLLSRAGADRDRDGRADGLGGRGLRARRAEPDAKGA